MEWIKVERIRDIITHNFIYIYIYLYIYIFLDKTSLKPQVLNKNYSTTKKVKKKKKEKQNAYYPNLPPNIPKSDKYTWRWCQTQISSPKQTNKVYIIPGYLQMHQ